MFSHCLCNNLPTMVRFLAPVGKIPLSANWRSASRVGAFGWSSRKRLEILRQIPNFKRICGIVFVVVWFVLDIAVEVISPESRWIMVNDGFSAGLGLVECLNAWIYLLYLFAPQKLRLQEQPEEE